MDFAVRSKEEIRDTWDIFNIRKVHDEEENRAKFMIVIKFLCCTALSLLVLGLAFLSRVSLLLLISATDDDSIHFTNKPFSQLILGCTLLIPNILTIAKCLWKLSFRSESMVSTYNLITVCILEAFASLGTASLVIICLPHYDILTTVFLSNSICLIPSILQVVSQKPSWLSVIGPLSGFLLLLCGYIFFLIGQCLDRKEYDSVYLGLTIFSSVLTSLSWWENFISNWKYPIIKHLRSELDKSRNMVSLWTSVVRIVITASVVGARIAIEKLEWETVSDIASHEIRIILGLFAVQAGASVLCSWFGMVACKIHAMRRSFILPLVLNTPVVLTFILVVFRIHYNDLLQTDNKFNLSDFCAHSTNGVNNTFSVEILYSEIVHSICSLQGGTSNQASVWLVGVAGACWWIGFILTTIYLWTQNINRIQRTSEIFVRRMYEAPFLEQSMLLNKRIHSNLQHTEETDPRKRKRENLMIYVCATLWHETVEEMLRIISSLFRLDRFKEKHWKTSDKSDDSFDFEIHIMFDDAFRNVTDKEKGIKKRFLNEYVESLIKAINETYRTFQMKTSRDSSHKNENYDSGKKVISTPYGGRLSYILPCGSCLYVHLKDKELVRHGKRWSQVMYMYHLLGWKLYRKHFICQQLHPEDRNKNLRKLEKEKMNTYILALDGDTEFQPSAVTLLIDRLRRYLEVGAACGRIHPTGLGPMVWYQKFEYAIGHWLQKTAEHVLGCVLCSPGCFSLFRAAALMDDNVIKKYTLMSTTAMDHIQYDQGEDRWLCLLLLQQGWRIEYCAGSDSYTNAPQEFKEFFNQRRRWDPSKIANTIDLLGNGLQTSRKNRSISRPFLLYQIIYMIATLVGPSAVCLVTATTVSFFCDWDYKDCLIISIIPPIIYLIVCYLAQPDTQIMVTVVFTVIYAFLMIGGVCTAIGIIVGDGTIVSPIGIFITSLVLLYFISALLHPTESPLVMYGLLYLICIPTASMLQPIYSFANLHITSWGTRESTSKQQNSSPHNYHHLRCRKGRWYLQCAIRRRKAQHPIQLAPQENLKNTNEADGDMVELDSPVENCWVSELTRRIQFTEDSLEEDETLFWSQLIHEYLKPLHRDNSYSNGIKKELMSLRNKAIFLYFMINVLWLGGTFFVQSISDGIPAPKITINGTHIKDEYLKIQPLRFIFLLSFATLILIQFLAMLYHRIYTFIHLISYSLTETSQSRSRDVLTRATNSDFN